MCEGKSENKVPYFIATKELHIVRWLFIDLKFRNLPLDGKHFRRSSSAIFVDDAVPQWVLYCVCGHKKRFSQLFGFCGVKGQLHLKFIMKFEQFMALM
jgi:hypothetical protein